MKKRPFEPLIDTSEFEPRLPRGMLYGKRATLSSLKRMSKVPVSRKSKAGRINGRGLVKAPRTFDQRVVVKARVVKGVLGKNAARHRAMLSYLNKKGAGLGGEEAKLYNDLGTVSRKDLSQQVKSWSDDPHHFRFIISPKKGEELDLESYVKRLMETVSRDLGTKLTWHAANHYDTDEPHAHVIVRGIDDKGKPLLISRDYISYGFRQAAEKEATIRLGERPLTELQKDIEQTLTQERYTQFDRGLQETQNASVDQTIAISKLWGKVNQWEHNTQRQQIKRLTFLESKGLAKEVRSGVWKVADGLKEILDEIAHNRKIENLVSPHLKNTEERKQQLVIHRESEPFTATLSGIVLAKDFSNELYEKRFLLLSADDGRTHFIPLNRFSERRGFESQVGQIVVVKPSPNRGTKSEEVIHRYLGKKEGVFDLRDFASHVKNQVQKNKWSIPGRLTFDEYINLYKIRLETLTKDGIVQKKSDTSWIVPDDFLSKIKERQNIQNKNLRVEVSLQSEIPLDKQASSEKAVWLDTLLTDKDFLSNTTGCFRLRVESELQRRKETLKEKGVQLKEQARRAKSTGKR